MATIARITRIPLDPPVNILRKHFAAGSSAGVSATGWLAGTASATPTDINIDFTPTAVGAAGLLFMGFTFTVPDEATTYKLYHPSIRIEH